MEELHLRDVMLAEQATRDEEEKRAAMSPEELEAYLTDIDRIEQEKWEKAYKRSLLPGYRVEM